MKILIFRGRRMSQIKLKGSGAAEGAMAAYKDFMEKRPDGSRRHERASRSSSTFIGIRAMSWRRESQAATSRGPKGRWKARRPKSIRVVSTETRGSAAMAKSFGNHAARGESPNQRSNQNRVEDPDPIEMDVPMRRTGRSWITDCQNWDPPVR